MDNKHDIKLHEDVASLKTKMEFVEEPVTTHIRSSIKELGGRMGKIERKIAYSSGAIAALLLAMEYLPSLINTLR